MRLCILILHSFYRLAHRVCLLLVDRIVRRPRYRSQAVPNRIRSFGFPQHLHSIRVTLRGPSPSIVDFPIDLARQPRALRRKHNRGLLPRRRGNGGDDDFSYCSLSIGNEMEDIEISVLFPLSHFIRENVQPGKM